jgi:hypothetical protein
MKKITIAMLALVACECDALPLFNSGDAQSAYSLLERALVGGGNIPKSHADAAAKLLGSAHYNWLKNLIIVLLYLKPSPCGDASMFGPGYRPKKAQAGAPDGDVLVLSNIPTIFALANGQLKNDAAFLLVYGTLLVILSESFATMFYDMFVGKVEAAKLYDLPIPPPNPQYLAWPVHVIAAILRNIGIAMLERAAIVGSRYARDIVALVVDNRLTGLLQFPEVSINKEKDIELCKGRVYELFYGPLVEGKAVSKEVFEQWIAEVAEVLSKQRGSAKEAMGRLAKQADLAKKNEQLKKEREAAAKQKQETSALEQSTSDATSKRHRKHRGKTAAQQ